MAEVALSMLKLMQWERDTSWLVSVGYRVETGEGHIHWEMIRRDLSPQKQMDSQEK